MRNLLLHNSKTSFIITIEGEGKPLVKRKEVEDFFKEHGFENKGGANHDKLQHPDGRWTVLGRHKEIPNRTFEDMKKQAGLK